MIGPLYRLTDVWLCCVALGSYSLVQLRLDIYGTWGFWNGRSGALASRLWDIESDLWDLRSRSWDLGFGLGIWDLGSGNLGIWESGNLNIQLDQVEFWIFKKWSIWDLASGICGILSGMEGLLMDPDTVRIPPQPNEGTKERDVDHVSTML